MYHLYTMKRVLEQKFNVLMTEWKRSPIEGLIYY